MASLSDNVRDNGLQTLTDNVNAIHICSQEPTTFTEATSNYSLGSKSTPTIGAPQPGDSSGRKVEAAAFSDGTVNSNGIATHYAWVDTINSILYVAKLLDGSQAVTNGNSFGLDAHDVTIPEVS